MVKNYKFFKQTNKKYFKSSTLFTESSKNTFKTMSDNYSNFIRSIFDNDERGDLIGFRFVRRFIKS